MKRILSLILVFTFIISLCSCNNTNEPLNLDNIDITSICELATLKCYYNNVVQIKKTKNNIFQKDREMWIEYEGIAVIGIEGSKLKITTNENIVNITMPEAKIIEFKPNKDTLNEKSYVVSEDGFFFKNKITADDQTEAITKGQEEMKASILANSALFKKAEDEAKKLIKNYIEEIGKFTGIEYIIDWK